MNPGCEIYFFTAFFKRQSRIGWVWGWVGILFVLSWVSLLLFFVFVLVLLGLSSLTDEYILPLLGKSS